MRVVVALGGNALLQRGEPMTTETQRRNVRRAAPALAKVAADHELVLSHGNGPQVGLLALQAAAYTEAEPSTLDVLGAETQGMIAYILEQELRNSSPTERFATVMTMVGVDPDDPAFQHPTKFVGPGYTEEQARRLTSEKGWPFRQDGQAWRRVVPSPRPQRIFELDAIRALIDLDVVVICAGGGGIPTVVTQTETGPVLSGVEAVIDKDLATELLAREIDADLFVMATDVEGVFTGWGTADQQLVTRATPAELRAMELPAGSMGPKVDAAAGFVEATGRRAAIGGLGLIEQIVAGSAGTQVVAG
ncbi:carbamate kinase [Aeromicrobium massiliense]|uniref:carbamate kinase n=1 Tax=Aeromicrobium massiliense TaxID=1464554 RepID=UPI000304BF1C|nr:carbamate kinase [Aeromicrobium massiliense]